MARKPLTLPLVLAVFLSLVSVYLLTFSGEFHSIDEVSLFAVTENLVKHGTFETNQMRWSAGWKPAQNRVGVDGDYYSKKGIGQSLAAAPLYWLGLRLPSVGLVQIVMLTNVLITALTGALLVIVLLELGFGTAEGTVVALAYGLGTMAWPYAKTFFSAPLTTLSILAAFYWLVSMGRKSLPELRALLAGLALGIAVSTRLSNLVLIPGFFAYLVVAARRGPGTTRRVRRLAISFALSVTAILLFVAAYNAVRFGTPWDAGYTPAESFSAFLPRSLAGFLLSPGRSLFVYSPILLLALAGLPFFWRQHRPETLLIGWITATYLLVYGSWFMWWGGWGWGPRFLVPLVPFLILPLAWVAGNFVRWPRPAQAAALLVTLISVGVQVPGVAVDFNQYLANLLAQGVGAEETIFNLRYWPVWGHLALLRERVLDTAWFGWAAGDPFLHASVVVPLLLVTGLATIAGYVAFHHPDRPVWSLTATGIGLLILGAATCRGLAGFQALPGQQADTDQENLIAHVQERAQPGDVLLLELVPYYDYFDRALSFMNDYRATPSYEGIVRSADSPPGEQEALFRQIAAGHSRLWLMTEGTALADPASTTERWYNTHAFMISNRWFGDALRLTLYSLPLEGQQPLVTREIDGPIGTEAIYLARTRLFVAEGERPTNPLRLRPGDTLQLELVWQVAATPPADLKVSVQLLDWRGQLFLQEDRVPVGGFRPATTWQPGEEIVDRFGLPLPDDLARGRYALVTSVYRADNGQRLLTAEGADHLLITEVVSNP